MPCVLCPIPYTLYPMLMPHALCSQSMPYDPYPLRSTLQGSRVQGPMPYAPCHHGIPYNPHRRTWNLDPWRCANWACPMPYTPCPMPYTSMVYPLPSALRPPPSFFSGKGCGVWGMGPNVHGLGPYAQHSKPPAHASYSFTFAHRPPLPHA